MKKSTKIFTLVVLLLVPVSIGVALGFTLDVPNIESIDYIPMDIGPELRTKEYPIRGSFSQKQSTQELKTSQSDYYQVGDLLDWMILDDYEGEYFFDTFELRIIGTVAELWVQVDMAYPDGRDVPIITEEHVIYMLGEFENDIAPVCNNYFGMPDFHDGSNPELGI